MKLTVPIYVESLAGKGPRKKFAVRPLFFPVPLAEGENLSRATNDFIGELRKVLRAQSVELRHEGLAAWAFHPELSYQRLDLEIALRRRNPRCRFLVVTCHALERRLAFVPGLPDLWFDVPRGARLEDRAAEVLTAHFRQREQEDDDDFRPPEQFALQGTAWVSSVDLDVEPRLVRTPREPSIMAFLGKTDEADGETELFRVGRCLDQLYPDDLDRVILRETELAELQRLLTAADGRPVLVVGPRLAGKTALIHEHVYRAVAARGQPHRLKENVWLISPQRLISGMSFVGQWEQRLIAILKHARKRQHTLYFDDLLGLYQAGITCQSDLSVAQVLKPYVERREVRLLGEITPEALRVLRERDRSFADLFHVLPVHEPSEPEVLRILIGAQREQESRARCRFELDVLPQVIDLERRYDRALAFPGKAANFLRRLAVKHQGHEITRDHVLEAFQAQSGLAVSFFDPRARLERSAVRDALARQVIGQPDAIEAAADAVSIAKARLNDPGRPVASFLFLGPTGVGKTQCAKALAAYLFGDAERLLRFDMNEFVSPHSAARLVGTFYQPEGLLTTAVREKPFAVVLFDEIEKAHPDVCDLLLQVLGEGRLTDALGRTVDFSNTILILTSNLGVRRSPQSLGFGSSVERDEQTYIKAAETFFRPEFFNRLDRVVPFRRLTREDVQQIARSLIQGIFDREGLLRRRCLLQIEPQALERIIDCGFDPVLGARALKRSIERQLAQPVAARLAAGLPESLTLVNLFPSPDGLTVGVRTLSDAAPVTGTVTSLSLDRPRDVIAQLKEVLHRFDAESAGLRPDGSIQTDTLQAAHYHYFAVRERLQDLWNRLQPIEDGLDRQHSRRGSPGAMPNLMPTSRQRREMRFSHRGKMPYRGDIAASADIRSYLQELSAASQPAGDDSQRELSDLIAATAALQSLLDTYHARLPERACLRLRAINAAQAEQVAFLAELYERLFREELGLDVEVRTDAGEPGERVLLLTGTQAVPFARMEEGTHLVCPAHGGLIPLQVRCVPLAADGDPLTALTHERQERQAWLDRLAAGLASVDDDPATLLPVLRVYDLAGPTLDLRTGLLTTGLPTVAALARFLRSTLPLPPEFFADHAPA